MVLDFRGLEYDSILRNQVVPSSTLAPFFLLKIFVGFLNPTITSRMVEP
jgi:hypothetical protein